MPRDEGVTAETDPEPMRWTHDDAMKASELGFGLIQGVDAKIRPHLISVYREDAVLPFIQRSAAEHYLAQKALAILTAQKLCGQ